MKHTFKFYEVMHGIACFAFLTVIGITIAACDDGSVNGGGGGGGSALAGTWRSNVSGVQSSFTFGSNGSVSWSSGSITLSGTVSGDTITLNGSSVKYTVSSNTLTLSNGTGTYGSVIVATSPYNKQ